MNIGIAVMVLLGCYGIKAFIEAIDLKTTTVNRIACATIVLGVVVVLAEHDRWLIL